MNFLSIEIIGVAQSAVYVEAQGFDAGEIECHGFYFTASASGCELIVLYFDCSCVV